MSNEPTALAEPVSGRRDRWVSVLLQCGREVPTLPHSGAEKGWVRRLLSPHAQEQWYRAKAGLLALVPEMDARGANLTPAQVDALYWEVPALPQSFLNRVVRGPWWLALRPRVVDLRCGCGRNPLVRRRAEW